MMDACKHTQLYSLNPNASTATSSPENKPPPVAMRCCGRNVECPKAIKAAEVYSRTKKVDCFETRIVLELFSFANWFCCDELKLACDAHLASLVCELEDAMVLIDYGLEKRGYLVVINSIKYVSFPVDALNCQKSAMHSLRLARNHSTSEHEQLVYEGWILYDTGHREEALAKAEESISLQRSFEAFFLKAYALADSNLDPESSEYVIQLLNNALRCPSDGLRKGQALNNLGSIFVDSDKLDHAADCYTSALDIKHTRAHRGLARVYHLQNQRNAAYDEMTKLIEKARNNASAYEKRSEYCDRDMAKSDPSVATQLDPLRTYPYRYRAAVLMDDHKEAEAIEELSNDMALTPVMATLMNSMLKHRSV